jgi:hypothetical protein
MAVDIGTGLLSAAGSFSDMFKTLNQHEEDKQSVKGLSTFFKQKGAFGMRADGTVDENQNNALFSEVQKMSVPGQKQVLGILAGQYIADSAAQRQNASQWIGGSVQKDVNAAQVPNQIAVETAKLQQQIDALKQGIPLNARSIEEIHKGTPVNPSGTPPQPTQPTQPVAPSAQNQEPANQHSVEYLQHNGTNVPVRKNPDGTIASYFDTTSGKWIVKPNG